MTCNSSQPNTGKLTSKKLYADKGAANLSDRRLIDTIMNDSQDTIYFKDSNSRFILNSMAHVKQFGLSNPRDLAGKCDADFYPADFVKKTVADEQEIMRTGMAKIGIVEKWERENGESVWFSASKHPLYNDLGQIVGTWGTSRDITALKRAELELERVNARLEQANSKLMELAVIDELSGLYNRRNFDEILDKTTHVYLRQQERGIASTFCLIILDIDDFKWINDTHGHLFGDAGIRHISNLLTEHTRTSDSAFRYGGDEFAVILPDTDHIGAIDMADRLRIIVLQNPLIIRDQQISLTVSLGVSCFEDQRDSNEMIRQADAMLYKSKREGKNRVS